MNDELVHLLRSRADDSRARLNLEKLAARSPHILAVAEPTQAQRRALVGRQIRETWKPLIESLREHEFKAEARSLKLLADKATAKLTLEELYDLSDELGERLRSQKRLQLRGS